MQDEETGRQMTDGILHAQVYTFMIAGHETTSVGLTWTLYLLAKHQEIQAKVSSASCLYVIVFNSILHCAAWNLQFLDRRISYKTTSANTQNVFLLLFIQREVMVARSISKIKY